MPVTNYIWDSVDDNVIMETDGANNATATYTHEPGIYGGLISQRRGSSTSYYHYDGLGSTRELTDDSETVTDTNLCDAWGVNVDSTGSTENNYRWNGRSGYYHDVETSNYYVRARIYKPASARWLSVDPLGFVVGGNRFIYSYNNVCINSDPSGLEPCDCNEILAGGGGVVGIFDRQHFDERCGNEYVIDIVSKSFINGIPRLGTLGRRAGLGSTLPVILRLLARAFAPSLIRYTNYPTADMRLLVLTQLVNRLPAFNENPQTHEKDGKYRLYTQAKLKVQCDCDILSRFKIIDNTMEGGEELDIGAGTISGTINMSHLKVHRIDDSQARISWTGWGRPANLVEPGMQWVAKRTSKNIWHLPQIDVSCKNGKMFYEVSSFSGSAFPSRRLWIDGKLSKDVPQGALSDLWDALPGYPSFVDK